MPNLLAQFILAARNNRGDDHGWVQILIFVILAAFYGLGSLLKAKAAKKEQQWDEEDEEGWQEVELPKQQPRQAPATPRYKPIQERPKPIPAPQQRPQVPVAVLRPVAHGPGSTAKKKTAPETKFKKLVGLKKKKQVPVKSRALAAIEAKRGAEEIEETDQTAEKSILDIEETDELRRAILYSEILAKPIALRNT